MDVRMFARTLVALTLLLNSYSGFAETETEWALYGTESLQAETLHVQTTSSEQCPVSEPRLNEVIDSELLRARIKRGGDPTVTLWVHMVCLRVEVGDKILGWAVDLDVEYCRHTEIPDTPYFLVGCGVEYGGFALRTEPEEIEDLIEEYVRNAIDAYLFTSMNQ